MLNNGTAAPRQAASEDKWRSAMGVDRLRWAFGYRSAWIQYVHIIDNKQLFVISTHRRNLIARREGLIVRWRPDSRRPDYSRSRRRVLSHFPRPRAEIK
jgi:hypothetical protein